MSETADIQLRDLSVVFRTDRCAVGVIRRVSTVFKSGCITGIIGESGSGKSVLGMAILRLLPDNAEISGSCRYGQTELLALTESDLCGIRGRKIGLIPQNPDASMNPVLKIGRQLTEGLLHHRMAPRRAAENRAAALLRDLGFEQPQPVLRRYPFQMSGGMNQRTVTAMGLSCNPGWLIADEPTKGLDPVARKQVLERLKRIWAERRCGLIVISHDLLLVRRLCESVRVMYDGEIIEQGDCRMILEHPLHPYTRGLIRALPSNGMRPIPGAPKTGRDAVSSCVYFARCPERRPDCERSDMRDFERKDGRRVRCFLYA